MIHNCQQISKDGDYTINDNKRKVCVRHELLEVQRSEFSCKYIRKLHIFYLINMFCSTYNNTNANTKNYDMCIDCGGGSMCNVRKRNLGAKNCGGDQICQRNASADICTTCDGSQGCEHNEITFVCEERWECNMRT
jgi:hypothetical protein